MENQAIEPTPKKSGILATAVKYIILALLLFTCIMAAYRKFGG
jgi:hypothetical protein